MSAKLILLAISKQHLFCHKGKIEILKICQKHHMVHIQDSLYKFSVSTDKIRNIGIIAHIDAGKTTLTEQLLFLTGTTLTIGSVDQGNTITDFMDLERERGITIQSSAVSLHWRDHRINLIDTPGHVDFTIEVERCLRVLDGTITVLDAAAGIQAQTLTVWRQAKQNKLSSIFFVNKMDKPGADYKFAILSIMERLDTRVVPIILPFYHNKNKDDEGNGNVDGFVNVLTGQYIYLHRSSGRDEKIEANELIHQWHNIRTNTLLEEIYLSGLEDLCLSLADVDPNFERGIADIAVFSKIPKDDILNGLRRTTLDGTLSPVACGSALHSPASVYPLLDMIANFLPSPLERSLKITEEVDICAFVFKVRHDDKRGQLNYVRLFRGIIDNSSSCKIGQQNTTLLVNANTGDHQLEYQIFTPFSDTMQMSNKVEEGNIAILTGLKNTKTGDTLVNCTHATHTAVRREHIDFEELAPPPSGHFGKKLTHLALESIKAPSPVFSCTIEPPNLLLEKEFQRALSELLIEDPSLRIRDDPNTGQKILEGMGELQIEVVKERLRREYNLNVFLGPLQIGYQEIPTMVAEQEEITEDQRKEGWCSMRLRIEPTVENECTEADDAFFKGVELAFETKNVDTKKMISWRQDWLKAINDGCNCALHRGPAMGFPVKKVRILLKSFSFNGHIQPILLSACANQCLARALKNARIHILEPLMQVEVSMVAGNFGINPEGILHELERRRANIVGMENRGKIATIQAIIPLAEMKGFAREIRTLSSGLANFHMESRGYQPISPDNVHKTY